MQTFNKSSDEIAEEENSYRGEAEAEPATATADNKKKPKPSIKVKKENDCNQLNGNGFVQIDIKGAGAAGAGGAGGDEENNNEEISFPKDPLMSIKNNKMTVYCENHWLVIQQRQNGFETNFNRTWSDYSKGFGSLRGDFWLGLETISKLTQHRAYKLLIELTDWSDQVFVAQYESFEIGGEDEFYKLSLSGSYTGNASKDFFDDLYHGIMKLKILI